MILVHEGETRNINLIDRVVVKVFIKNDEEMFRQRESGILVMNQDAGSNKAFNFGKLVELPFMLTEDKYLALAKALRKDMTIFFSASKSYNYIAHGETEEFKLLMIPLYDIDAFYAPT